MVVLKRTAAIEVLGRLRGDSLFVRWWSEDRPPSVSVWMARCGGCLSTGVERDIQALKGDVTAERIGMLFGCEGKTAICT